MNKLILLLALFFSVITLKLQAQQKWAIRGSFGSASGINAVDGYFYSFDVGIPLFKSLEIAPTFSFVSTIPSYDIENSWNARNNTTLSSFDGSINQTNYGGDLMGSASLLFLFKPFELFKNSNLAKHELAIGTGIGFKSYSTTRSVYDLNGDVELIEFGNQTNQSIEPYYGKVFYNYHFSDQFFAGLVAGLDGYDAEATALFGFQIGFNFSVHK
nr:hypothetical protein [uncultured Carboxylicivirga sp.]